MTAAVDNAADARQVRSAEKRAKELRKRELADLREVLKLETGRRVIWRLLERCNIYRMVWHEQAPDGALHFNEGMRNIGLFLMHEMAEADPYALVRMMQEAAAAELQERIDREKKTPAKEKSRTADDDEGDAGE